MIPDFSGDFLNYDSTQDGDVIEIVSEGEVKYNETLKKDIYNIKVKKNGKDKVMIYSPNNKAGKQLQDAFGMNDLEWVGKKFNILHVDKKMHIRPLLV